MQFYRYASQRNNQPANTKSQYCDTEDFDDRPTHIGKQLQTLYDQIRLTYSSSLCRPKITMIDKQTHKQIKT